jgi:hypothetical protein
MYIPRVDAKDRLLYKIPPAEFPAALRLLSLMESCGQISSAEAVEWRRRIEA